MSEGLYLQLFAAFGVTGMPDIKFGTWVTSLHETCMRCGAWTNS